MRKLINLQLFADEEVDNTPSNEETPTEEVENDDVPEFDESTETEDEQSNDEADNSQTKDKKTTNKENAERRIAEKQRKEQERKAKAQAEEKKKAEREAYLRGIKRALGDKNPYTDKPIVDDEDLEEYEIMKKLDEEGKDPIEDFADYIKEQKRQAKKQEETSKKEEEERMKFVNDGIAEVDKRYGAGTAEKYLKDKDFQEFGTDFINSGVPLPVVIGKYMAIQEKINHDAEEKALEKDARRKSSPGGFGGEDSVPQTRDWANMSSEEFHKRLNKILENS